MTVLRASFDSELDRYRITSAGAGSPTVRVDLEPSVTAWFELTGELAELAFDSTGPQTVDGLAADLHDPDAHRIVDSLCGPGTLALLIARHRSTQVGPDDVVELGELHVADEALAQQQQVARTAWANSNPAATPQPVDGDQPALPTDASVATAQAVAVWSGNNLNAVVDAVEHGTGTIDEQSANTGGGRLVRVGRVHVHLTDAIPDGISLTEPARIAWQPDTGQLDIQIARNATLTRIPDGWWIRISTANGTTLAVAPLEPAGGAHTLLATLDDTLDGTVVDITVDPTRSIGGSNDRIRARLARLAAIAHEAEHDNDSVTAAHAWHAAAHVAADHGDTDLAEHLRERAGQHQDHPGEPRSPRARNVAPGHRNDISADRHQRTRRQRITVASIVAILALLAAAAVWAFAGSDDADTIGTSDDASAGDPVSESSVPDEADTTEPVASAPPATEPETTEPVATEPVATEPVVVDSTTAEYAVGDPTPFTGLRERIVLTVQTPSLTADQPLQVEVAYARTTPGDPWAPGASLMNCLNAIGQVLPGDVTSPFVARTQLTTGYRAAPAGNGTDNLDQYNEPDGDWTPLTVTTPTNQLTAAAATSAVIGCLPPGDPPVGPPEFADRVRVAYEHRYQPITVAFDVTALAPGTYTLAPVLVNGIPTDVNPQLVTFTIIEG